MTAPSNLRPFKYQDFCSHDLKDGITVTFYCRCGECITNGDLIIELDDWETIPGHDASDERYIVSSKCEECLEVNDA